MLFPAAQAVTVMLPLCLIFDVKPLAAGVNYKAVLFNLCEVIIKMSIKY